MGKGLPETYIMHELTDPPQPGPEQQALALCQIDGKVASFKIMVKGTTDTSPFEQMLAVSMLRTLPPKGSAVDIVTAKTQHMTLQHAPR